METIRPLDILNNAKGKEVTIALKNETIFVGKVKTFDIHLNIVLFDAFELKNDKKEEIGSMLIRGDTIVTIKNLL